MSASERKSARYARQLDVSIEGLEIVTSNVAAGGVQLCCPEMRYRGFCRAARDGIVGFKIRVPGSGDWLSGGGQVRYADLCEDEYLIGFQFTAWEHGNEEPWSGYIATLQDAKPID